MSNATNPDDDHTHPTELRSFGRKRGRAPGPRQARLLSEALPNAALDLTAPFAQSYPVTPPRLWLEIGFGGAEHLLWQAEHNRDVVLIGCEPFEGGVIKALAGIEELGLTNLRLHADDARPLLRWLPEASVERAFVLFPDPWPKKKHVKRRLVAKPLLDQLARAMLPGGELRVATDIGDYARTILLSILPHSAFIWPARSAADWRERSADWPQTRYEAKAIREGRARYYFRFQRRMP